MQLEAVSRLNRDIIKAMTEVTANEARFLVDAYYMIQGSRIRANNQEKALEKSEEPHDVIHWLKEQDELLEKQIRRALDYYTESLPIGRWAKSIVGVGPVIAAGLISRIDIKRAPMVGHIWSYAGLDPRKGKKGEKLNHDPAMKRLCWLIGESFVKVKGHEDDIYGKLYEKRKQYEAAKNEAGEYADMAKKVLEEKNIGKTTEAYKWYSQGKLPPAHIHARAKRYAVKMFLSHLWETWYKLEFKEEPPKPFAISILGHGHYMKPPEFNHQIE